MVNVLSIGTICISLYLLGAFLLVNKNVGLLVDRLDEQVAVTAYLSDHLADEDRARLLGELRGNPLVAEAVYISQEEAKARFREYFHGLADLPDYMDTNPFPASLEIRLVQGQETPEAVQPLLDVLAKKEGVVDVDHDIRWVQRLGSVIGLFRVGGWLLGSIFLGAAAFTITNVMKLAIYSRREEIQIMQLIGAPLAYIKGPFLIEGALHGGIGALLAISFLAGSYSLFQSYLRISANVLLSFLAVDFLSQLQLLFLLGVGLTIGLGAGFLSVYRFLLSEG
jgi:cell division transport system permease protein